MKFLLATATAAAIAFASHADACIVSSVQPGYNYTTSPGQSWVVFVCTDGVTWYGAAEGYSDWHNIQNAVATLLAAKGFGWDATADGAVAEWNTTTVKVH